MGVRFEERKKFAEEIMEEMEKRGFDQGEAEIFPNLLESTIKQNNERFIKDKPFAIYKG